mmetsp:Transcript_17734/g.44987  ORF Transcript_17734/g.44987 Transcript_17734/m.44987 type:complete len:227 (-) Transcript_17734:439-1119(-)
MRLVCQVGKAAHQVGQLPHTEVGAARGHHLLHGAHERRPRIPPARRKRRQQRAEVPGKEARDPCNERRGGAAEEKIFPGVEAHPGEPAHHCAQLRRQQLPHVLRGPVTQRLQRLLARAHWQVRIGPDHLCQLLGTQLSRTCDTAPLERCPRPGGAHLMLPEVGVPPDARQRLQQLRQLLRPHRRRLAQRRRQEVHRRQLTLAGAQAAVGGDAGQEARHPPCAPHQV